MMEEQSYQSFLKQKQWRLSDAGISIAPDDIHPMLFDFQRDLVRWAVRKGRAAIFAGTGMGKTLIQISWSVASGKKVLIVCPLAVAQQTIAEGEKIGVEIIFCSYPQNAEGIWITNYEKLHHFVGADFYDAIVLDECFVAGTQIDTPAGTVGIENLKVGDWVYSAFGPQKIKATKKSYHRSLALISIPGKDIISSTNHPFFTQRGWVMAKNLKRGDRLVYTTEAMRMVQSRIHGTLHQENTDEILREILFSEMAHESTDSQSKSSQSCGKSQSRESNIGLVQSRQPESIDEYRTYPPSQSNRQCRNKKENLDEIERDGTQTIYSWREWKGAHGAAKNTSGTVGEGMDSRICNYPRGATSEFPHLLQGRPGLPRKENSGRSRWIKSCGSQEASPGQEKGREVAGIRVDHVTIYQSDNPLFARYRDETNRVAFYDLEIEGHPSFSVYGLLVHNSSILKSLDGKTRSLLIKEFTSIPRRLCCTATPSPNDLAELANHAEFLGVMKRGEMLSHFFVHDADGSANVGGWRLKGHAQNDFWKWVASWSIYMRMPSDLDYDDNGFILPPLSITEEQVDVGYIPEGELFPRLVDGIKGRSRARRASLTERVNKAKTIIDQSNEQWLVWCELNDEQRALAKVLGNKCVSIEGSTPSDEKIQSATKWKLGHVPVLLTKPKIFGWGMNWEFCHNIIYVGLSDSFESYFQATRRCWRFGQQHPVNVTIVTSKAEHAVVENVWRKERQADELAKGVIEHMKDFMKEEVRQETQEIGNYETGEAEGKGWRLLLGDCVERIQEIPDSTIGLTITSIPFSNLFTYSPSTRDLGNCSDYTQFFEHFGFLIPEWLRVTKPGRRACVHVQQVGMTKVNHGVIGWYDFRGDVIRCMVKHGWIYDSEVVVDKNPQIAAVRTKSKGLLFTQKNKDSSWSHPAMADYVLLFRKDGENQEPIKTDVTNEEWIKFAHPIWTDIKESDTLNAAEAREEPDEKHLAPLQLEVIKRCIRLWSNENDLLFDPFSGLGSTGYVALQHDRQYIGIELKKSYYLTSIKNLKQAEQQSAGTGLFANLKMRSAG